MRMRWFLTAMVLPALLAGGAAAAEKHNRAQVFVAAMANDLEHKAGSITNLLRGVMKQTPGLQMVDLTTNLKAPAPKKVEKLRDKARQALQAAKQAMRAMEHREAANQAARAREAFEKMGGYLEPLARYKESLLILGASNAMQGDIGKAQKAFLDLLLLDRHIELPKSQYEGFVIDVFHKVEKSLSEQPRGSLSLKSEPPGANLYLDGKLRDVTPVSMDGLVAGRHLIMVKMPGYENWGQVVQVEPGEHAVLTVKLTPGQAGAGFVRISSRACKAVSDSDLRDDVLQLGQNVGLDWAVLGQLEHDAYDLGLRLYLFDFILGRVVYEDELVLDSTGYGMEGDVESFGGKFLRRGMRELKEAREAGDPLAGASGTESWYRDDSGKKREHSETRVKSEGRKKDEGDPLDELDGTEDW